MEAGLLRLTVICMEGRAAEQAEAFPFLGGLLRESMLKIHSGHCPP